MFGTEGSFAGLPVFGKDEIRPARLVFTSQEPGERAAVEPWGNLQIAKFAQRREKIDEGNVLMDFVAAADSPRGVKEAGHAHGGLVEGALPPQAVLTHHVAVVRPVDDDEVVEHAEFFQRGQGATDLLVEHFDHPAVGGDCIELMVLGERLGMLDPRLGAVGRVEVGDGFGIDFRQSHQGAIVFKEIRRADEGIVRNEGTDAEKERPLGSVAGKVLAQAVESGVKHADVPVEIRVVPRAGIGQRGGDIPPAGFLGPTVPLADYMWGRSGMGCCFFPEKREDLGWSSVRNRG